MSHEPGSTILAYSVHWLALKVLKALLECPLRPLSTRVSTEPTRVSPESTGLMPWLSTVTLPPPPTQLVPSCTDTGEIEKSQREAKKREKRATEQG